MAGTYWAPIRTSRLIRGSTVQAYRALQQTGVSRVHVGEHLSQRDALGRLQLTVMVANRTREIRPSGMKRGACGNVGVMGVGLRPIGKSMESPPDPTMLRAPHFYPNDSYVAIEVLEQTAAMLPPSVMVKCSRSSSRSCGTSANAPARRRSQGLVVHGSGRRHYFGRRNEPATRRRPMRTTAPASKDADMSERLEGSGIAAGPTTTRDQT